MFILFYC